MVKTLEGRFVQFTQISFAIFALVIGLLAFSSKASTDTTLLSASLVGAGTVALSVSAILIAFFSYLQWRLVKLVPDRYGTVMANRARDAQRFLRKSWWTGTIATVALSFAIGLVAFYLIDPFFIDMRTQRVITQKDLNANNAPIAANLGKIIERLESVEKERSSSKAEIENLKAEIDRLRQFRPDTGTK